jgi:hypothetical protein
VSEPEFDSARRFDTFRVGVCDQSSIFRIGGKVYGRASQVDTLLRAFDPVASWQPECDQDPSGPSEEHTRFLTSSPAQPEFHSSGGTSRISTGPEIVFLSGYSVVGQ